jgi:hypothetical protein
VLENVMVGVMVNAWVQHAMTITAMVMVAANEMELGVLSLSYNKHSIS